MWNNNFLIKLSTYANRLLILADDGDSKETASPEIDKDPFSYIKDNKLSSDDALRNTAISYYQLMMVIGVIGLAFSLFVGGYKLASSKNGNTTAEAKKAIITKMIIGSAFFGLVEILGIVIAISRQLA